MRWVMVVLLGLLSGGAAPAFIDGVCDMPGVQGERLRCGTVAVPRDYARPDGPTYRLAVAVIRPAQPRGLAPVVYMSGGPGSPLLEYAGYQARHPLAAGRDIVLVDQRGVGRSEPDICRTLNGQMSKAVIDAVAEDSDAARERRRGVVAACRADAVGRGIDLADFGTAVTVADFDRVREALGVARWDVFGVSYGTTVAMTMMAEHPEHVGAAVLDSLFPPDPMPLQSVLADAALRAFFDACAAEATCAGRYPGLGDRYRETLARLGASPLDVPRLAEIRLPGLRVTASLFSALVEQMVYYPRGYPALRELIATAHDGNGALILPLLGAELMALAGTDHGLATAVECRDRPHFREALPEAATSLDRMQLYGVCAAWSALGPAPVVPERTPVPVLVLAGAFDPVSGPALSRAVADRMGAQWVKFAGEGHSVRSSNTCAQALTAAFFADPTGKLNVACATPSP